MSEIVALSTVKPGDCIMLEDNQYATVKRICVERQPMKFAELSENPKYFKWQWPKDPATFNIERYLRDDLEVYDADNCGSTTSFWIVVTGDGQRFYKCYHSWWIEDGRSGYDGWNIRNDFEIEEITKDFVLNGEHPEDGAKYSQQHARENMIYVV